MITPAIFELVRYGKRKVTFLLLIAAVPLQMMAFNVARLCKEDYSLVCFISNKNFAWENFFTTSLIFPL